MKLVIDGHAYDASAQPFIGDLRLLRKEFGFGWGTVAARLSGIEEGGDWSVILDDEDTLDALVAWMWMARLRAGERSCTRADAEMTALDQIDFVPDDRDVQEAAEAVPTSAPTGSVRGVDHPPAAPAEKATTRSTKTSKPRSISA